VWWVAAVKGKLLLLLQNEIHAYGDVVLTFTNLHCNLHLALCNKKWEQGCCSSSGGQFVDPCVNDAIIFSIKKAFPTKPANCFDSKEHTTKNVDSALHSIRREIHKKANLPQKSCFVKSGKPRNEAQNVR